MNELLKTDVKMTSLDIAEIVGKEHKNVMRDIRNEIEDLGNESAQLIFEPGSYKDKNNQKRPYYEFGKDGAMQLALKYDAKTRFRVIKRIEELENAQQPYKLPGNYKEALIQLVESEEEKEKLETQNSMLVQQNNELQPKADYTDKILKSKGTVTIGQIAKDYGMSAQSMNKKLHELRIQYKQGDQWLLYSKYQDKGYTHSNTIDITRKDGTPDVTMNTKWTQKGRLFLYELLKENEIIPIIEQEVE
ncbi:phage regulatory protein/antirepressor Ant [Oceanobacillus timonensis]|uniref:phage regulatory protein/antirepressor Ant n=1 Tax=Oceanobacillus timonensis TaxID=1926285 RepID=UPI0009B9DA8E|nr:phage regulatory protein/antirepressor Ant [Oceanobacillus timonensis]